MAGVQIYPTAAAGLPVVGETGALTALDDLLRFPVMGPDPDDLVVRAGAVSIADFKTYLVAETQAIHDATQAIYDAFDDRFLGVFAADPTTDNEGDPLVDGAQYFNSVALEPRIYIGSSWYSMNYNSTNVAITGGTVDGVDLANLVNPLAIADGGTGGATKLAAVTALGLGTAPIHATADETDPNAIELLTGFGITTVPVGLEVTWVATAANTGAMTIAVDGGSASATSTPTGAALPAGFVRVFNSTTNPVRMRAWWNGTKWVVHRGVEVIDGVNGTAWRYEDGRMECHINTLTLGYSASYRVHGVWTFPAAFKDRKAVVSVTIRPADDADTVSTITDDATIDPEHLGAVVIGDKRTNQVDIAIWVTNDGLLAGDDLYVSIAASGAWY